MANVTTNITVTPNACRENLIGCRGVCDTAYPYYLDSYGISLSKTAKLADSSKQTARELIEESVDMAWGDVFNDLRVDGFTVNGVRKVHDTKFTESEVGDGTYTKEIIRTCDIEQIYVNTLKIKGNGTVNLKVNYGSTEVTIYNDTLVDETLTVTIDSFYNAEKVTFTAVVIGDFTKSDCGGIMEIVAHTQCNERLFFCKYWTYLVKAVMLKASAYILNASLFSDRYNDLIIYKKDEIALRVSQLDKSFNLMSGANTPASKGMYQDEITKINLKLKDIVKQSYCTCCFECDTIIKTHITLP